MNRKQVKLNENEKKRAVILTNKIQQYRTKLFKSGFDKRRTIQIILSKLTKAEERKLSGPIGNKVIETVNSMIMKGSNALNVIEELIGRIDEAISIAESSASSSEDDEGKDYNKPTGDRKKLKEEVNREPSIKKEDQNRDSIANRTDQLLMRREILKNLIKERKDRK